MDEFYDHANAAKDLEDVMNERKEFGTGTIQLDNNMRVDDLRVFFHEDTNSWRLCSSVENSEDHDTQEAVFRIQGIVCAKHLPPFRLPQSEQARIKMRPFLQTSVTITGLDSPTFRSSASKIDDIYMTFYNHIEEGKLEKPDPLVEYDEGHPAIAAQSRIFTKGRGRAVAFKVEEDPNGTLQKMASDGYNHTEDSVVMFQQRSENSNGTVTYITPRTESFREGDIVEIWLTFVAFPCKNKAYKMVHHLKNIVGLNHTHRDKANIKRMSQRVRASVKVPAKRKVSYSEEDAVQETRLRLNKMRIE